MANPHDAAIARHLASLPENLCLPYLFQVGPMVKDHAAYWQMVAGAWMQASVTTPNLAYWESLFCATRPGRHKLMKKSDRRAWRKLPAVITAYRAVHPGEDITRAISWTISQEACPRPRSSNQLGCQGTGNSLLQPTP